VVVEVELAVVIAAAAAAAGPAGTAILDQAQYFAGQGSPALADQAYQEDEAEKIGHLASAVQAE
jgi:hypothetical protein